MSAQERYAAQVRFEGIGEEGQRRIGRSCALLVGCGALGSVLATTLARAGVGRLRICDRDDIEVPNLQRQILFDESDIAEGLPKAEAAARKLRRANSAVEIESIVADVDAGNIARWARGADVILDGTDNFETRYLINDFAVLEGVPWVYGAVIGAGGLVMPVLPGETPCLRCVFEQAPPAELSPTCDTAGVLASAVQIVASLQALEALKLLAGRRDAVVRKLVKVDAWEGRVVPIHVGESGHPDCPCCGQRRFEYLSGQRASVTTTLCGRNAVQVRPGTERSDDRVRANFDDVASGTMDLVRMGDKLLRAGCALLCRNAFLLRARVEDCELTLFAEGRAVIRGTDSPERARSLYARYIGS